MMEAKRLVSTVVKNMDFVCLLFLKPGLTKHILNFQEKNILKLQYWLIKKAGSSARHT